MGEIPAGALRAAQDEAIREVVQLQQDCGLQVVTDGEFRRVSYWEKFVRLTRGLEVRDAVFTFHDAEGHESKFTAPYVSGKVSRAEPITLDELGFGNNKITMPAPSTMHFYRFTDWGSAYDSAEAFFRTSARSTRPRSPTWRRRAAATCSSTRWRSRSCAIRRRARR